jgi:16S rRNA (adenine1518-N6/adenine1519-N6)-dimethyltransferase
VADVLLGPAEIRALAATAGVTPAKALGQNFLHDPNTVRRIVRAAELSTSDVVVEVGPGLGSLTLGLLPASAHVTAVEVDRALAAALPSTVDTRLPEYADRLTVLTADALRLRALPDPQPTVLVGNLPYNVAVPVILHLVELLPSVRHGLVMVQAEVAERLAAAPGSRSYGVPSVKLAWWCSVRRAGQVPRTVFWPVPNVDSALVALTRREPPTLPAGVTRAEVFSVVDAAFAQRRKTLRSALASWAGSPARAEALLRAAGVDPGLRGEALGVTAYASIAAAASSCRP